MSFSWELLLLWGPERDLWFVLFILKPKSNSRMMNGVSLTVPKTKILHFFQGLAGQWLQFLSRPEKCINSYLDKLILKMWYQDHDLCWQFFSLDKLYKYEGRCTRRNAFTLFFSFLRVSFVNWNWRKPSDWIYLGQHIDWRIELVGTWPQQGLVYGFNLTLGSGLLTWIFPS